MINPITIFLIATAEYELSIINILNKIRFQLLVCYKYSNNNDSKKKKSYHKTENLVF